jgi:hypothetical protein
VHPQQLAGSSIKGNNRTPRPGSCKQNPVDYQRGHLQVVFGLRPERLGAETPGHLEIVEV